MRNPIADDQYMGRRGVGDLLSKEAGWEICGEATDAAQAIQKASELNPDLVLLDISLPDGSGLEAARRIREEIPPEKIVCISHHAPTPPRGPHKFVRSMRRRGGPGAPSPAPAPATSRRAAKIPAESPSEVFAGASRKLPAGPRDRSKTRREAVAPSRPAFLQA